MRAILDFAVSHVFVCVFQISMVIFILTSRLRVDTEDIVVLSVGGTVTILWFFLAYDCVSSYFPLYFYVICYMFYVISACDFS